MRVTIIFESNLEDDGVDTTTSYSHNNVEDLSTLAWVLAEGTRAGGYFMADRVVIHCDNGKKYESDF
jgi:hypothetical protein